MEIFSALLSLSERNLTATDGFPSQRPLTQSSDVFFDLRLINGWANNRDAGDLRRHCAIYGVTVKKTAYIFHGLWVQCSDNVVNTSWLMPVVSLDTTMSRHTHFTVVTKYFFHGTLDIFTTGMLVARWHWKNRYRASLSLWWILEPGLRHKHCPDGINTIRESSRGQADISTDTQFFCWLN